ncbi:MAG: hypothetical protein ACLTG0_16025 [Oscillibacter sp.]
MGLYDSVDRGKPKPKRLTGPIALCCALFLLFGGLTYWACHYQFRFHAFISDLTDSTRDARSTETFRVTVNGSETDVSIDDLSDLLYLIDKAGAGRTAAAPEEMPYAVIDYGDGSTLEILEGRARESVQRLDGGAVFPLHGREGEVVWLRHGPAPLGKCRSALGRVKKGAPAGCSLFARPQGAEILQPERAAFLFLPHCAGVRIKGDILFLEREYPPYTPKRKDEGRPLDPRHCGSYS